VHPTVKSVAMVADAILDCSARKGILLDAFAGTGTTLVAAHKTGRRGYGRQETAGQKIGVFIIPKALTREEWEARYAAKEEFQKTWSTRAERRATARSSRRHRRSGRPPGSAPLVNIPPDCAVNSCMQMPPIHLVSIAILTNCHAVWEYRRWTPRPSLPP
jgi:hypothetical protein